VRNCLLSAHGAAFRMVTGMILRTIELCPIFGRQQHGSCPGDVILIARRHHCVRRLWAFGQVIGEAKDTRVSLRDAPKLLCSTNAHSASSFSWSIRLNHCRLGLSVPPRYFSFQLPIQIIPSRIAQKIEGMDVFSPLICGTKARHVSARNRSERRKRAACRGRWNRNLPMQISIGLSLVFEQELLTSQYREQGA